MIRHPFNLNIIEVNWWMIGTMLFLGKQDFYSLLSWVWIKTHFPLVSPFGNQVEVVLQICSLCLGILNNGKEGSVICKELDIRLNTFFEVINVYEEQQGTKD